MPPKYKVGDNSGLPANGSPGTCCPFDRKCQHSVVATSFDLVTNRNTAKALGFDVPPPLLTRADEIIG